MHQYWKSKGFSLVELLVAMAVMLVVLGAVFLLVNQNQKAYQIQQAQLEAGQNARIAVERIGRELLSAGYNTPAGVTPINVATAASVAFSGDTDDNGTSERVTFTLSGNAINRTSQSLDSSGNLTGSPVTQQVAINVSSLIFRYFLLGGAGTFVRNRQRGPKLGA